MPKYQFAYYTNIPHNRPISYTNYTSNTPIATPNQRTDSFTESSSSALNDDIMYIGEKRGLQTTDANPNKVQKLDDASDVSHANVPIEPLLCSVTQVEYSLHPLPKPVIPEEISAVLNQNTITASSSKDGLTTQITITSPKKLPNDQKAITTYCKQEAYLINENITNSKTSLKNPFVDPTYDAAFKYLFSNLALAENFIHSILELKYKITSLKPINVHLSELQQGNQYNEKQASLAVDGLFKIKTEGSKDNKMLVFLEMQRKPFPGFLMREQIYSALIATNTVKKGISKKYDNIPKVIGIIISLKNILQKEVPYCSQISTTIQSKDGDLINVQFSPLTDMRIFELEKFQRHSDHLNINKNSSNTLQWLNFLLKCGQTKAIPDNTSDVIKLAYNHMKQENMKTQDLALIEASIIKAQLEEKALNQQLINTAKSAEIKGKVESAVGTILNLIKIPSINTEIIAQAVDGQFNNQEVVRKIVEYIKEQPTPPGTEDIIKAFNLLGDPTDNEEVPTQDLADTILLSDNSWVLNAVGDEELKERDINDSPLASEDPSVNPLGDNEYYEVAELFL